VTKTKHSDEGSVDYESLARYMLVCEGELRLMGDEYERTP